MYSLLTGHPIFASESLEEALAEIRASTPTSPRKYQKSIPREFDYAIMRLLAKKQEDRYQSPAELLAALRPLVKAYDVKI